MKVCQKGILFLIISIQFCFSNVIYVDMSAQGDCSGESWQNACLYIQDGLSVAAEDDTLKIAQGSYCVADGAGLRMNSGLSLELKNGMTVQGGYAPGGGDWDPGVYCTVIDGKLHDTMPWQSDQTEVLLRSLDSNEPVLVEGLYFNDAYAVGSETSGGAIYAEQTYLTIRNCVFTNNVAHCFGAAVYALNCNNLLIENCEFYNNQAHAGGAVYFECCENAVMNFCEIKGNSARYGAGIQVNDSGVEIMNTVISGNAASLQGGAIRIYPGSIRLENCSLSGNASAASGTLSFYNSSDRNSRIENSIIWNNDTEDCDALQGDMELQIVNSDIQGCYSGWDGVWNDSYGTDMGGNIDADPLFVLNCDPEAAPSIEGDLHLQQGSPCLAAAQTDADNCRDLDALMRPQPLSAEYCDMGAFEFCEGESALSIVLSDISQRSHHDSLIWNWTTESETENAGFILELSKDNKTWKMLSAYLHEPKLIGQGSSSHDQVYRLALAREICSAYDYYRILSVSMGGEIRIVDSGRISRQAEELPRIGSVYPNPFNPRITLCIELETGEYISAAVFNCRGEMVTQLYSGFWDAGRRSLVWQPGNLPGGVYICRLEHARGCSSEKMIYLR